MINKKTITGLLIAIIIIGIVVAVFWQQNNQESNTNPTTVSIIDDAGRNVTVTKYPARIVSLAPSSTEVIFGLDLADKLVGSVSYSGYTQEIKNTMTQQNITGVGTFSKVNVELVIGLQPDLIIASGSYQQSLAAKFEEHGKAVMFLNPKNFSGILADITLLGTVTGQDTQATTLVTEMSNRAQEITAKSSNLSTPSVYVEYYFDQSGFSSYGAKSYVNELISMAGGVNVFADFNDQYITTSTEEILRVNPSLIIISKGVMSNMSGITPQSILNRESWNNIAAIQTNSIYEVDESLLTIWGPRIVNGIEELAKIIHPEVFNGP